MYTGKQLFSYFTPTAISFTRHARDLQTFSIASCLDVLERKIIFEDGTLLTGQICKATLGSSSRGIIHRICHRHDRWRAAQFISDAQRVVTNYLNQRGFSIGIGDCVIDSKTQTKIKEVVSSTLCTLEEGTKKAQQLHVDKARIEDEGKNLLSDLINRIASVVLANVDNRNSLLQCIISGSKGKKLNICQVC